MSEQPPALLNLSGRQLYSEHGFVVIAGSFSDDDNFWNTDPGGEVVAGPGWVRVGGGVTGVFLDLSIAVAPGDGPGPPPGATTLRLEDNTLTVTDPVSSFGVTWPMPTGIYQVVATITDLTGRSTDTEFDLPAQSWLIELTGWPD